MTKTATREPNQRRERRALAREDRKRSEQQRQQRQRLKRLVTWGGLAVIVLAVAGYGFWNTFLREYPGQAVPSLGNQHVAQGEAHIAYNSDPPTSGPHFNDLASWGVHSEPVQDELQIHNLEDSGVNIQYNCDNCQDLVNQLTAVVNTYKDHVLLAPRKNMDATIALTAWGRIDKFNDFDETRIRKFIDAYRGIDHHPVGGEASR